MAVMSPQPPISAPDQKVSSAPTPASAGAGSMASDEAMGMDLDNSGTIKQNETSSTRPDSPTSPRENDKISPFVNGNKGITAPPSPPIPTPPLHSSDAGQELSDLHITSPDGSVLQAGTFEPLGEDLAMEGAENKAADQTTTDVKSEPAKNEVAPSTSAPDGDHAMQDVPPKKNGRERDDGDEEDDGDRPLKRAKTADATESQTATTSTSTSTDYTGPLTPARAKFVLGVIRSLRRSKDGRPFSMPVDAEKLNVPTYYDVIKKPMDLQTMERKLNANEYTDLDGFVADFKQILENCVNFNGVGHIVTEMSHTMEAAFYRQMKDLPGEHVVDIEKPKTSKKKGHVLSGAAAASHQNKASGASKSSKSSSHKKESKSSAQSPTATSPVFSLQPSGMPQIRRDSTAGDGRPKREIHPPAPKDLPYSTKPRRKQNAAELKFCESVLKELHRKPYEGFAFPFYHPVDPVALNIPEYFKIIKKPMDLSTIQEKLKINAYDSADEFEADMRLMFNNCYKFNPPNQPVHKMGKQLEELFDSKWSEKPSFATAGSRSPQSASPLPHEEEMSEDEDEPNQNIAELEKKLEKMKEEISAMKKGQNQKKKTPPAQNKNTKSKPGSHGRKASTTNLASSSNKKKSGKKDVPYISLEQKTELSQRINLLPPQKMHYALVMIKEMMPDLGNDGAEIELDIDELDPHTLHKLYKYVSKNAPEIPKTYVPPPAPTAMAEPYEPKPKAKAGSKGRKNKPMSAAEQEAKIKDIESRLHSFDNPGSYTPAAPVGGNDVQSDSSDDDESSGSESEEE